MINRIVESLIPRNLFSCLSILFEFLMIVLIFSLIVFISQMIVFISKSTLVEYQNNREVRNVRPFLKMKANLPENVTKLYNSMIRRGTNHCGFSTEWYPNNASCSLYELRAIVLLFIHNRIILNKYSLRTIHSNISTTKYMNYFAPSFSLYNNRSHNSYHYFNQMMNEKNWTLIIPTYHFSVWHHIVSVDMTRMKIIGIQKVEKN